MTKFEELIDIYTKSGNEFNNYRWKCIDFAKEIGDNLAKYLECKEEDIQYYTFDKEGKPLKHIPETLLHYKMTPTGTMVWELICI